MLVIRIKVAVLAEAFGIMRFAGVQTRPSFLRPPKPMIAINAHALRVVLAVPVRAVFYHSLG